jgi:hypothetical protein
VAIADGVVRAVDNFSFGLQPHNVVISHEVLGYTSLYGHLHSRSSLVVGQPVQRGQIIGFSGDPDMTCVSRPHLHLEIRNMNYSIAYNPATLIDADWTMLSTMGTVSGAPFAKDLYNPRRWQTISDQPNTSFGGSVLNNFRASWPLPRRTQAPPLTLPAVQAPPLLDTKAITFHQLTEPGCCSQAWWSWDSRSVRFWDGPEGQRAETHIVSVDGTTPASIDAGTYKIYSLDGRYYEQWDAGRGSLAVYENTPNGREWTINSDGAWARFSPGSSLLLWDRIYSDPIPGAAPPRVDNVVASLDGSRHQVLNTLPGVSSSWLDDDRVLLARRVPNTNTSELSIYTLSTSAAQPLLTATFLRGVSIAPGGKYLVYQLLFQSDSAASGLYLLETTPGATPKKLSFYGDWRWRGSNNVLFIPYILNAPMSLSVYDIASDQISPLLDSPQLGFRVANGDWSVSPDGRYVMFWSADDYSLRAIQLSK